MEETQTCNNNLTDNFELIPIFDLLKNLTIENFRFRIAFRPPAFSHTWLSLFFLFYFLFLVICQKQLLWNVYFAKKKKRKRKK